MPPRRPPDRAEPARRKAPLATWEPVTRLDVYYQDDGEPEQVGGLVLDKRGTVHFQYDPSWLDSGRELSPRQLPLSVGRAIVPASDRRRLHGVHGLFADSLPDYWGMRVLDIAMRGHGIDPLRVGALGRLAWLGNRTMGALTYRPAKRWPVQAARAASLESLAAEAEKVYDGTVESELYEETTSGHEPSITAIDALERAAVSAGGAQPKILIAASPDGTSIVPGADPQQGQIAWLLKFTPRRDGLGLRKDTGQLEHAYAQMARDSGINMPETRLFQTADGRSHFAVVRFDRTRAGGRRHVHTFGGIMGREAGDAGDYDELLRLARGLTGDVRAVDEVVRRLCFNLAVLNDDDHLKNVAFLLDPREGWALAPAYDVTFAPSRTGERGMSVAGLEADATWQIVGDLALRHGIKGSRLRQIRAEIASVLGRWPEYAADAHVPDASISEVARAFQGRQQVLDR